MVALNYVRIFFNPWSILATINQNQNKTIPK